LRYCQNCIEPDTRPGQHFDEAGICVPCSYALKKIPVDWDARREELKGIVKWAKANKKGKYDCVLGVSGGKDSTTLAFFCREMGMEPLLVSSVPVPELLTDIGAHNLANLAEHNFDIEMFNIAPEVLRQLMKKTFIEEGNFVRATEYALVSSMPRTAIRHGIPLICGGENPYVTVGSKAGSANGDASNISQMNTLQNGDLSHLYSNEITSKNLYFFRVPLAQELEAKGLRFIYLGYYLEQFDQVYNANFAIERGMRIREGEAADPDKIGSHYPYYSLEDDVNIVHQMMKHVKLGFGFAAQQLSLDIRVDRITREKAIELARRYDGNCDQKYIDILTHFFDMTNEEFWDVVNKHRNKDIWLKNDQDEWELKLKPE